MSITYASISSLLAQPFQRLTSAMWNTASLLLLQLYETGGNAVTKILQNGNLYIPNSIIANSGFFSQEVYVSGQPVLTEEDPIYIAGFISTAQQQIGEILQSNQQLYNLIAQTPYDIYKAVIGSIPSATQSLNKSIYNLNYTIYELIQNLYVNLSEIVSRNINNLYHGIVSIVDLLLYSLTYIYLSQVALANTLNKLTVYISPPAIAGLNLNVGTKPSPLYNGQINETVKIILQNLSNYIVYIGNNLYNNFPILPNSEIEITTSNPKNIYAWATGPCQIYALFEYIQ